MVIAMAKTIEEEIGSIINQWNNKSKLSTNEITNQNSHSSGGCERWHNLRHNKRRGYDKFQIECYNYKKYGHDAYEYRNATNNMKRHVKGTKNKDQEESTLLLAYKGES